MRIAMLAAMAFSLAPLTALAAKPTTEPPGAQRPQTKWVGTWVGTWAASPMVGKPRVGQPGPANATYRDIVHTSIGGGAYRIQLTNEFGLLPLKIGAVQAGLSSGNGSVEPGTSHAVLFHGQPNVTIPPGAMVYSDPVRASLPPESNLAISVYLPAQPIRQTTCHFFADTTNYIFQGNGASDPGTQGGVKTGSWCFVKGVDVLPEDPEHSGAVVALGDSITDGVHSTRGANRRWPDVLAARLLANPSTSSIGVLNEGIGGNCILNPCAGQSALRRFNRDVLAQSGVKYLILFESINDICRTTHPPAPRYNITTQDLIYGMEQMVERAHEHGIKVFGATITPYQGDSCYSAHAEQIREELNHWIRTGGAFDGVIDFDKVTRDPDNPKALAPAMHSSDHVHPGDAGYKAMGDSINLNLFH